MKFSEAIKLKDNKLYNLERHQARVDRTLAKHYGGGGLVELSELREKVAKGNYRGLYKCRVLYGESIESIEITPYNFRQIERVAVVEENQLEYSYKYADREQLNRLVRESNCDDVIIVQRGLVTDASYSNLVFSSPEGLFTPDSYLLRGTKRQQLIDTGIINEREITVDDIKRFDTVHFINAMIDIEDRVELPTKSLIYI